MKRLFLVLIFALVALTGLAFITQPTFNEFITNQLAAAIGINIQGVYDYQTSKGISRELAMGDRGKDVKMVQHALRKLTPDFPEENVTGYYGEKTSDAVSNYQKDQGLPVTGKVDRQTRNNLNEIYLQELCPEASLNNFIDEILIKVNRDTALPKDYIPQGLVKVSLPVKTTSVVCLKEEVALSLLDLVLEAKKESIHLGVTSGFRKPEIQGVIYKIWVSVGGDKAKEGVAEPLHSEHQLGTTVDLTGATNNYISVDENFERTPEGKWLRENAYRYGFVMSYPRDKASITGYRYEPWHYRFVGIEAAKDIFERKISVEEYLSLDEN